MRQKFLYLDKSSEQKVYCLLRAGLLRTGLLRAGLLSSFPSHLYPPESNVYGFLKFHLIMLLCTFSLHTSIFAICFTRQISVSSTPLFRHRPSNAWKSLATHLRAAALLYFLPASHFSVWMSSEKLRVIGFRQAVPYKFRQTFQPIASSLCNVIFRIVHAFCEHIRINNLICFPVRCIHKSNRIFDTDFIDIGKREAHKEYCRLCPFYQSRNYFFCRSTFQRVGSCCHIRQISARRMCNQQIPLAYIVCFTVHGNYYPPLLRQRVRHRGYAIQDDRRTALVYRKSTLRVRVLGTPYTPPAIPHRLLRLSFTQRPPSQSVPFPALSAFHLWPAGKTAYPVQTHSCFFRAPAPLSASNRFRRMGQSPHRRGR